MVRLGLRLAIGSGREAALRLLVTAAAIALGVALLLLALAAVSAYALLLSNAERLILSHREVLAEELCKV